MGFDIYGRSPKNKKGYYFRNNCWWWRPLTKYVLTNVSLPETQLDWGMNNGCKVSKKSAELIAKTLKELIKSGETKKYEKKIQQKYKSIKTRRMYSL